MHKYRFRLIVFPVLFVLFSIQPAISQDNEIPVFDQILSLYDQYDLVHLGERHWNLTDYNFRTSFVNYPKFAEIVDDIIIESGNYLYQDLLDDYILALKDIPDEELCQVWRNSVVTTGVWDATIYKDFIKTVRKVNEKLPRKKRIRLIASEPPINWSEVKAWQDYLPYFGARDSHSAEVIESEVVNKKRKAFIIYGGAHFFRTHGLSCASGNLLSYIEDIIDGKVFVILPISGEDDDASIIQDETKADKFPLFVNLSKSKLSALPGINFFLEADGSLGDFTDGILYFGIQPDNFAEYDSAAANDSVYQNELLRRQALRDEAIMNF
jgi:hypothetical protein